MQHDEILLTEVLLESCIREAARYGVTGPRPGADRLAEINRIVTERTHGRAEITAVELLVYPSFGEIGTGENFVDANGNGVFDDGDHMDPGDDLNGDGLWNADIGQAVDPDSGVLDEARQVVLYRVEAVYRPITPLFESILGTSGALQLEASVPVRNEPWD